MNHVFKDPFKDLTTRPQYTPEPWVYADCSCGDPICRSGGIKGVVDLQGGISKGDAQRAALCVNACVDAPSVILEQIIGKGGWSATMGHLFRVNLIDKQTIADQQEMIKILEEQIHALRSKLTHG